MINRVAIRDSLIEAYKPKEVEGTVCALCGQGHGLMSLHLLEASIPETNPLPPRFVSMSRSRGFIRGSFPVCADCAPICSKCGVAMQSKMVGQAYEAIKVAASPGSVVSVGNGYCRHLNLLKRIGQRGLPADFKSPFDRIGTPEDVNRPENEADGYRAGALRRARWQQAVRRDKASYSTATPREAKTRPERPIPDEYVVGDVISGKYKIQRIFEGGMGRVFVVKEDGDPFVLKSLKGEVDEAAFLDEARAWVSVGRHENIVPAFWVDQVGGMLCVAAEYIPPDESGRSTLRDVIRFGSASPQQIISWMADFCYGMEHAQSRGVRAHRDIKPENLLVGNGHLQITDFGIASSAPLEWSPSPALAGPQRFAGTPSYMPPEQWLGGEQGFPTDVYAFGVVLHELVFGRHPWPAASLQQAREAHFKGSRALPTHPMSRVVSRCIAVAPEDRFQAPLDLLTEIAATAKRLSLYVPPKPEALDEHREELFARAFLGATGNREHALAAAQTLTEKWPGFSNGWTQLGRIHLEANELDEALNATKRALEIDETRSPPWNNLGLIYGRLRDHDRAIAALQCALDCDAQNSGAMSNLATVLMRRGKFAEAIPLLERAIEIAPDKPHLWVNLGSAQQSHGQTDLASKSFEKALLLTPKNQRGELAAKIADSKLAASDEDQVVDVARLLRDRKFDVAVPLLIEGTKREPMNAGIWHNLALAHLDQGDSQSARHALLKLSELEPTSTFALRNLLRISEQLGDWIDANQWCDRLAKLPGMFVESKALRANLMSEQGLKSEARELLVEAIRDHPNQPALFEMLGDLALRWGAPGAAVQRGYAPALQIIARAGQQGSIIYARIEQKHREAVSVALAEGSLVRRE